MITEVSAVKFRQNLGEMLSKVEYRSDSVVIQKDGRPVGALIDMALFERIRTMNDRFYTLTDKLADGYAQVPEDEGLAEIDRVAAEVRKAMAKEASQ